jgi:hypothetical protein
MYERPRLALGIGQLSRFGGLLPVDRTVAKMKECTCFVLDALRGLNCSTVFDNSALTAQSTLVIV